jgi:hypothetical protein
MSDKNQKESKEITIAELAEEMHEGFKGIAKRFEGIDERFMGLTEIVESIARNLADFQRDTKETLTDLTKGLFTEQEKEEVLAMVRHYDQWLVEDAKGEKRITLTRPEYDTLMESVRLPNRFVKLPTLEME